MRYEVIKDFQYTNEKMQIMILSENQVLDKHDDDWYVFTVRNKGYEIASTLVENNPLYFKKVDWRPDLLREMKKNKKSTTVAIHKHIVAYIDNVVLFEKDILENDDIIELLKLAREKYNVSGEKYYLDLFDRVGWAFDDDRIWKKF